MRTVHEVSKLTGVSIRTLHYYDKIGLLLPTDITVSGYRLYDDTALERLQSILLFRELQFPLKEIKEILDSPEFDREKALDQQITLLKMKKEHLENLIHLAHEVKTKGAKKLDFSAFDTKKMDDYAKQAKAAWGHTDAYKEYEQRNKNRTDADMRAVNAGLMELFVEFGRLQNLNPAEKVVQEQVKKLQEYITEHFYTCTPEILKSLGEMYGCGGDFTKNINNAAGEGAAEYASRAIEVYCRNSDNFKEG